MPDALTPQIQPQTENGPGSFFDKIDAAETQRTRMAEIFEQVKQEIKQVFDAVKAAYPKFTVEVADDRSNKQFPSFQYQALDIDGANRKKSFTVKLAVIANPDRKTKSGGIKLPGPRSGNIPLLALVIDIGDTNYYGAHLLKDRYRLDRQGGFDEFATDLGFYCGVVYGSKALRPLTEEHYIVLRPKGKAFGL